MHVLDKKDSFFNPAPEAQEERLGEGRREQGKGGGMVRRRRRGSLLSCASQSSDDCHD